MPIPKIISPSALPHHDGAYGDIPHVWGSAGIVFIDPSVAIHIDPQKLAFDGAFPTEPIRAPLAAILSHELGHIAGFNLGVHAKYYPWTGIIPPNERFSLGFENKAYDIFGKPGWGDKYWRIKYY